MLVNFPIYLDGREITVSEEVETQADLFKFLADMQETFGNLTCTRNGKTSDAIKMRVRDAGDDGLYYELYCYSGDAECFGAKKSYGVHKKGGGLFPKSKNKDGEWLPNSGWMRWNKEKNQEE